MKTKILYLLLACGMLTFAPACSDDYEDASTVHVYGPNENPPVKANSAALISTSSEVTPGDGDIVSVKLDDYADKINDLLGMTVDELISNISSGKVEVWPINPNRNVWNRVEGNAGSRYSWYVNSSSNVCEANDATLFGTLSLDLSARSIDFAVSNDALGQSTPQLGFLVADSQYKQYVRFAVGVTAVPPSVVYTQLLIPEGDYSAGEIYTEDIAKNIEYVFGMTPQEFEDAYNDGVIGMYMISHSNSQFVWDGTSTANNGGYWVDSSGEILSWGDGCAYYIEPWFSDEEHSIGIGRYPGMASGTVYEVWFGFALVKDHSTTLTIYCTATLE